MALGLCDACYCKKKRIAARLRPRCGHAPAPVFAIGLCRECFERQRAPILAARRARRRARFREKTLGKYGLTAEAYQQLLESQGGVCALCRRTPETGRILYVDHCHETGRVRGLLHSDCNLVLGHVENRMWALERIPAYLAEVAARLG